MRRRHFIPIVILMAWSTLAAAQQQQQPFADRSPAAIYSASCANCHGANHQGGNASSLADGVWAYGSRDQDVFRNIKHGITTMGMPAYGETFTDEEISALAGWLRQQEQTARVQPPPRPAVEKTKLHAYRIETVVEQGLKTPWAIDWLPDGRGLITEKDGRLRVLKDGQLRPEPVQGIPPSRSHGQGGLMDVAIDPQYATQPWIYLSYTHQSPDDPKRFMTRIVRGQLEGNQWTSQQVIWEAKTAHYLPAGVHFGNRIVFDSRGLLYFSIGDRGEMNLAQDLKRPNGKHHRIHRDGRIPDDNPFVNEPDAYKSIYSYGNRNPQGLAIHPSTDQLWSTEHGPMGGDELNLILPGRNYGWPVITYGINYNGRPISDLKEKEGMEQPVVQWTPSPAMCGLAFYTGDRFEQWKGDLLAGALKFEEVKRLRIRDNRVIDQEVIFKGRGRVRDVNVAPDGYIYLCLNGPDRIVRLVPAAPEP